MRGDRMSDIVGGSRAFLEAIKGALSGFDLTLNKLTIDIDVESGEMAINIRAIRE